MICQFNRFKNMIYGKNLKKQEFFVKLEQHFDWKCLLIHFQFHSLTLGYRTETEFT